MTDRHVRGNEETNIDSRFSIASLHKRQEVKPLGNAQGARTAEGTLGVDVSRVIAS